jgi:hypothetical protein
MPFAGFSPLETGLEIMKMILRRHRQGQNGLLGLKRGAFGQIPCAVLTGAAPAVIGWHAGVFAASFMRHLHRAAGPGRCLYGANRAQGAPAHRQADAQAEQEGDNPVTHGAFVDLNVARARFECEKPFMPSRCQFWSMPSGEGFGEFSAPSARLVCSRPLCAHCCFLSFFARSLFLLN